MSPEHEFESFLTALAHIKAQGTALEAGPCDLVPVTEDLARTPGLARRLAGWRSANLDPFLKLFRVTVPGTEAWLQGIAKAGDRILFLIRQRSRDVGHIGCKRDDHGGIEVCDVLRGEPASHDVMISAMRTLLEWGHGAGLERIHIAVASDLARPLALYHRSGFRPERLIPLRKVVEDDETRWEEAGETDSPDRFFLRLVHEKPTPPLETP